MTPRDLEVFLLTRDASIRETISRIDASPGKIVLVVDQAQRLLGTVTDGDVRRGILSGRSLEDSVDLIMNNSPRRASIREPRAAVLLKMRGESCKQMPIVDDDGKVVDLQLLNATSAKKDNLVLLMAGGRGTRLRPLTEQMPKPLLPVGGRPILETILEGFIQFGFGNFAISVNYMGEMVEDHFQDGSAWGVRIDYLREDTPLGTAGALALLPNKPRQPVLVMNGDILTKVNFDDLLSYHHEHASVATLGARRYDFEIPFGVIESAGHSLTRIIEKPVEAFLVNAGLYVLEPDALDLVVPGQPCDMPTLLMKLVDAGKKVSVFPIREYWLDIGRPADFDRAVGDFGTEFR